MQATFDPKIQNYNKRLSNIYLAQCLNFMQYLNIINKIFIPINKIENQLNFPFGFTSGDLFAFITSECLLPSNNTKVIH